MAAPSPRPLAIPAGPAVLDVLPALEASLTGRSPVLPYAADDPPPAVPSHAPADLPDGLAVAIGTSGSTGRPKRALLTADALERSAWATHQVLGGSGAWLLAMPAHHIAGLQVLLRSIAAGVAPAVLDLRDGFSVEAFAAASARVHPTSAAARRYTALVPTQLSRLVDDPAGVAALRGFDGVLVGGAATPPALVERARALGVVLSLTYGMSETAGGCVYDGIPLPVSRVHVDNDRHVVLGGDTVAHGYLGEPGLTRDAFTVDPDGVRWFRTDDLGHFDDEGPARHRRPGRRRHQHRRPQDQPRRRRGRHDTAPRRRPRRRGPRPPRPRVGRVGLCRSDARRPDRAPDDAPGA